MTLLTEMADSIALVMRANGDDPTKVDDASFGRAIDRIQKAVDADRSDSSRATTTRAR